jgi:hypothetical protein
MRLSAWLVSRAALVRLEGPVDIVEIGVVEADLAPEPVKPPPPASAAPSAAERAKLARAIGAAFGGMEVAERARDTGEHPTWPFAWRVLRPDARGRRARARDKPEHGPRTGRRGLAAGPPRQARASAAAADMVRAWRAHISPKRAADQPRAAS